MKNIAFIGTSHIHTPNFISKVNSNNQINCIGVWDNELAIIDWKTSNKVKKEEWVEDYFLQATAYSIMYEERTKTPVGKAVIVVAVATAAESMTRLSCPRESRETERALLAAHKLFLVPPYDTSPK